MKIRYTPKAVDDLREIQRYIIDTFDEETASRVTMKIVSEISTLKEFPGLMRPLSEKIHRAVKYHYFFCAKCSVAILDLTSDVISVIRILDQRSDYAQIFR